VEKLTWVMEELRAVKGMLEGVVQGLAREKVAPEELGFGKRPRNGGEAFTYLFINQPNSPLTGDPNDFWYWRSESEGVNHGVKDEDLTGFITSVYRRDSIDRKTGKAKPVLNVQISADKPYVLQTGFYTNFASSLLAGLAELPAEAVLEPLTLRVEQTPGRNSYPTTFCQLEWRGERVERIPDSSLNKDRLVQIQERFGFKNPLEAREAEAMDG
jgi:hypothetical protein